MDIGIVGASGSYEISFANAENSQKSESIPAGANFTLQFLEHATKHKISIIQRATLNSDFNLSINAIAAKGKKSYRFAGHESIKAGDEHVKKSKTKSRTKLANTLHKSSFDCIIIHITGYETWNENIFEILENSLKPQKTNSDLPRIFVNLSSPPPPIHEEHRTESPFSENLWSWLYKEGTKFA